MNDTSSWGIVSVRSESERLNLPNRVRARGCGEVRKQEQLTANGDKPLERISSQAHDHHVVAKERTEKIRRK